MKSYCSWDVENEISFNEEGEEIPGEEYVLIASLFVDPSERGQGVARKLLKEALQEIQSEKPGMTIKLAAYPTEKETDLTRLVAFYETEGFSVEACEGCHAVIMRY